MMAALGMFIFSLTTLSHQELSRRTSWRHVQSSRVGAREANQFVGPGEDSISLSGMVATEFQDGDANLSMLRDMAEQGEAWPLVDGTGQVFGSFVITGLDEKRGYFYPDGRARRIEFDISLLQVDDEAQAQAQ